jgi:hypothetical protein
MCGKGMMPPRNGDTMTVTHGKLRQFKLKGTNMTKRYGYYDGATTRERLAFLLWRDGANLTEEIRLNKQGWEVVATFSFVAVRNNVPEQQFISAIGSLREREEILSAVVSGGCVDKVVAGRLNAAISELDGFENFKPDLTGKYKAPPGDEFPVALPAGAQWFILNHCLTKRPRRGHG